MAKPQRREEEYEDELPNFEDILDRDSTEVERPRALPRGSYLTVNRGLPKFDKSSNKQTPFAEFTLQVMAAREDVDEEELERALTKPSGEKVNLSSKSIQARFYLTPDAEFIIHEFLDNMGIPREKENGKGMKLRDRIAETPGKQVIAYIKHEANQDGTGIRARLGRTAPVD